ncbi:MAG: sugar ABC transporter ATP-binding protein [Actinomycetaceae bacterium]|nr:sugar ABC transporter ATP-binding protein [Actinomycetaceae bacterium]
MISKSTEPTSQPVLTVQGMKKNYGGVHALKGIDFSVLPGEVHALVGENGAGKSTLIKMISGAERPSAGKIFVNDEEVPLGSTQASFEAGVSTVYQSPQLFGELTAAENIFIGRELKSGGRVRWIEQKTQVRALLERLQMDPQIANQLVADLPVGEQQLVSIAKAFATKVKLLILDEPSAILTDSEVERLFHVVREMRKSGVGIIYISHRLDELQQISDRITVMRDGNVVATLLTKETSRKEVAGLMIGREMELGSVERPQKFEKIYVKANNLKAGKTLKDISFHIHEKEIVGFYGLIGSGTSDLARALTGLRPMSAGNLSLGGETVSFKTPQQAAKHGVTLLPGNRTTEGVFLNKSLSFNLTASHLNYFSRLGFFFNERQERKTMLEMMEKLRIKAPQPETAISSLSGGNQQKVVMARQIVEDPKFLVLEEPTQGVDIGAKEEIHQLIFEQSTMGRSIAVISTDLEELRRVCDRVLVLYNGEVVDEFDRGAPAAQLLAAASGERRSEGKR